MIMEAELDILLKAGAFAAAWILVCWYLFGRSKK